MTDATDRIPRTNADILHRLERARTRETRLRVWTNGSSLLTVLGCVTLLLIGLESISYLSPTAKTAILVLIGILALSGAGWGVVRPFFTPVSLEEAARRIEHRHGGLHQHLINAVQLGRERNRRGVSDQLIDAAIAQASDQTANIDFTDAFDGVAAKTSAKRLVLVLIVGALGLLLIPGPAIDALARLTHPTVQYVQPRETRLSIAPGDTMVIVDESLTLKADIEGIVPLHAILFTQEAGQDAWSSFEIPIRENRAVHEIASVRRSFAYRWQAHDADTEPNHVLARPRPVVLSLVTRYHYPAYTGLPGRTDVEGGDIAALKGTEVDLQIRSSRPLAEAWLSFEDADQIPARAERDSAFVKFRVDGPARFTIGLRDTVGIPNANPVTYRVLTLKDEPPAIVVLRPGSDSELGERMEVPLLFEATDDFGVARVDILYRVNQEGDLKTRRIDLDTPDAGEIVQATLWDLSQADLMPGDQITYRLRATDINTLTGPGIGETPEYVVRFPSLHEIHEAARRTQEETVEQLEELSDRSRDLRERMKNVSREILKNEEATWEDRAEIRDAIQEQEQLREEIEQQRHQLDQMRQRLEQSGLLSAETIQKVEQIRELMAGLSSPELDRFSQELRDAMEQADPEMIQEALDRLAAEQETFQLNLDRTIALLKRVRDEQMLDALSSRLRDLAQNQQDIHSGVETRPVDDLAERQSAQTREAEHLVEALTDAAESIEAPDRRLESFAGAFEDARIPDRSSQSARDLKAEHRDRAQQGTKQLAQDLDRMATDLESIKEAYRQAGKDELTEELSGIFRDLLSLSRSQERTATEALRGGRRSDHESLSGRQTRDMNAAVRLAERLMDTSRKTFLVPPQAGVGLQNATAQIQKSMGHLQRNLGDQAGKDAREAMAGLNSSAMGVRNALAAVKSAGSATGLDEMLQQLAQASDRQGDLNAETEGAAGQSRPGGQSGGGTGGLPRLSAEQQAIQQMLDDLRRQFSTQEGDALGDLGKVSEDMADVARRLARNQLDQPTVERQRRILSRLLDAQRSLRQRGFSNDREAKVGEAFAYRGPGSLPMDLGESNNPLRARLKEALRQGYPEEYQTLIRRYFDRLIEDAAAPEATP